MKRSNLTLAAVAVAIAFGALLAQSTLVQADTIAVNGDTKDYLLKDDDSYFDDLTYSQTVGGTKTSGAGRNFIYIFALPVLDTGYSVTSADLGFDYDEKKPGSAWTFDADLWGIGFETNTNALLEYFEADSGDTGNTKIQDGILTYDTSPAWIHTDATGDANLGAYLQTFYDGSPSYAGGSYVFLRLNPDADPGISQGWMVDPAEVDAPVLTITAVPEPSALVLLTVGAFALLPLLRRRRR